MTNSSKRSNNREVTTLIGEEPHNYRLARLRTGKVLASTVSSWATVSAAYPMAA
ncbi:MAG: hypothetical protein LZF86_220056 [Nitrospira sp.]|nr:MAG: hypothetical protein LZF86_220056 [Nitrospira sp.]